MARIATILSALLLFFGSQSVLAQQECLRFLDTFTLQCKNCGDTAGWKQSRYKQASTCITCSGVCRQITPIAPADVGGEQLGKSRSAAPQGIEERDAAPACDYYSAPNEKFYAVNVDRKTLSAIADESPATASLLLALRTRDSMPSLQLHNGDFVSDAAPSKAYVMAGFDHGAESPAALMHAKNLATNQFVAATYDITDSEDGTAQLTLSSSLNFFDEKKSEPIDSEYTVKLKRTGETRPVSQLPGTFAYVYDVVGFGSK